MLRTGRIRQVIRDVIEGAKGPYASLLADLFTYEEETEIFEPNADEPLGEKHLFDVVFGEILPHEASPVGVVGDYRIVRIPVTIEIETKIPPQMLTSPPPQNNREMRDTLINGTTDRLDLVSQSLATPETLTRTAAGELTGIISGQLRSPDGTGFPEVSVGVWNVETKKMTHEIRARALVKIDR